jgi:uncharacterized protein
VTADISHVAVDFAVLFVELLALLLAVSAVLALVVRRAGLGRLHRWLGGSPAVAALKGAGLGFVVPFCTYSAIPLFVGMVDTRVRSATWAGFLLAAPLLDPLVLAVLVVLFGWQATLAYAVVTAVVVLLLALAADALGVGRGLRPARQPIRAAAHASATAAHAGCEGDPFSDDHPWRGLRQELPPAGRYAWSLVRGLAAPMAVAVAIAAAIVGFVPEQLLGQLAGPDNPLAVPVAAALGAPFYVSTEAFLPIAAALHAGGMALGPAFALVISAAGINLPELALLTKIMRPRLLIAYTAAVVSAAVAAGYLIPLLL